MNIDVDRYKLFDSNCLNIIVTNKLDISMLPGVRIIFRDAGDVEASLLLDLSAGQLKLHGGAYTFGFNKTNLLKLRMILYRDYQAWIRIIALHYLLRCLNRS